MDKTKLLETLRHVTISSPETIVLLNDTIRSLENEIMLETKPASQKQRINACLKVCEKLAKSYKKQLACTNFIDGKQIFTDSAFMVELTGDDIIPELPRVDADYNFKNWEHKANDVVYPETRNLWNNFASCDDLKLNANDLLKIAKVNKTFKLQFDDDKTLILCGELTQKLLTFFNTKNETLKVKYRGENRPLYLEKSNGSRALITPMRGDETQIPVFKIDNSGAINS